MFTKELFNELNRQEIEYAVLRNYQQLPDSCGGSDLDIWVAEKDYNRFMSIIEVLAKECAGVLASYIPDDTCPRLIFQAVGWGIQMDVHIGVAQHRGVPYINNTIIESHIIEHNGVKVLAPEIDGLISFLKEVLNNKECKDEYCVQAANLIERLSPQCIEQYLQAFSKYAREKIVNVLRNRDFSKESIRALGIICSNDLQTIGTKARYHISQLAKLARVFNQPGYTIAVLGTDGSGKSFIINKITPILNEAFHKGVRYEHMRPNHLPSLAVALGKKKADEPATVCSDPHGSKPSGFMGSLLRLSYYWIDYTWGYFRKVRPSKDVVWFFDRYYYDYYVDQRRARLSLPNWVIKLFGWFVPCPDLTICLGGDPAKIYARKPETSLEEVTRQTMALKDFTCRHKRTVWVDTTVAPEESVEMAMKAIVEMMSKRFAK